MFIRNLLLIIFIPCSVKIGLGILPLELETVRYTPIYDRNTNMNRKRHLSEILCTLCNTESREDEIYFLLVCPLYKDLRYMLLDPISQSNHDFSNILYYS